MKKIIIIALVVAFVMVMTMGMAMAYDKYEGMNNVIDGVYGSEAYYLANPGFVGGVMNPRYKDVDAWEYSDGQQVINANRTGEKVAGWVDFRRNVTGQNVHTNFQKNTNSCASCHMTHTAAGAQLLFRAGTYATCSACHDGSGITFLNVFLPSSAMVTSGRNNTLTTSNTGTHNLGRGVSGTFGVDTQTMNGSVHMSTGDLTIAAAPGGNRLGTKWDGSAENTKHTARWSSEFSCTSCHAPHGSYSQRLMHYNVNRISSRVQEDGGLRIENLKARINTEDTSYYYLYPVDVAVYNTANAVKGPWLYGYVGRTAFDTNFVTVYHNGAFVSPSASGMSVKYRDGKIAKGSTYTDAQMVAMVFSVSPALEIAAPTRVGANFRVQYTQAAGLNYNLWCAGCHTDYERALTERTTFGKGVEWDGTAWVTNDATGASAKTGIFSKAHRHTTYRGSNGGMEVVATTNMICVSCHFVHGSDTLIMKTADEVVIGKGAAAIEAGTTTAAFDAVNPGITTGAEYIAANMDINTSSALKRYTNMAICWKCHTSSHAEMLHNNHSFYDQYDNITAEWHKYNVTGTNGELGQYGF